jgi:hypothetical protein
MISYTTLKPHHVAWLACHPKRTEEWLLERLADGFHVHHADGNHSNDAPNNLILVEGVDHIRVFHCGEIEVGMKEREMNPRQKLASRGGRARANKLSPWMRKVLARRAARARWNREDRA